MSRVLVTGGTGALGSAVVRRLLADPAYDVRVADRKAAPQWMREGCEIRDGDLREFERASAAVGGCRNVIHLATPAGEPAGADYSLITESAALDSSLLRAAVDHAVERFVYVSCAAAERPGAHPEDLPARTFARLFGERLCRAAHAEHGLSFTILALPQSQGAVGPIAEQIVAALGGRAS